MNRRSFLSLTEKIATILMVAPRMLGAFCGVPSKLEACRAYARRIDASHPNFILHRCLDVEAVNHTIFSRGGKVSQIT